MAKVRYKIVVEYPDEKLVEYATSHNLDHAERIARVLSREIGIHQVGVMHKTKLKALFWRGRLEGRNYV